uniref:Uncharacterized protein n=1 Tax=Romanomermis culicivorax TaxID=13658 RepID=A0A915I226_ROMCU
MPPPLLGMVELEALKMVLMMRKFFWSISAWCGTAGAERTLLQHMSSQLLFKIDKENQDIDEVVICENVNF